MRIEDIVVRRERDADVDAIAQLTRAAFLDVAHSDHAEEFIIAALRAADALAVSLVAQRGAQLVGHIAFSPVAISDASPRWYGLGPVSVTPAGQRNGVGSALVRAGLDALRASHANGCVVLGWPNFYQRFGFEPRPQLTLASANPEHFLALPLSGTLPTGEVRYHAAFSVAQAQPPTLPQPR
jgi:putative acetyltransferase